MTKEAAYSDLMSFVNLNVPASGQEIKVDVLKSRLAFEVDCRKDEMEVKKRKLELDDLKFGRETLAERRAEREGER